MALTYTPIDALGTPCPDFHGQDVFGKLHQKADYQNGKPFLVMFICNHCPYVKAIEDRLIQLCIDMQDLGMQVLAISSNDAAHYPEDSLEKLRQRHVHKQYPFPYLYDASQAIARQFGAVCTPDFFLYDGEMQLAYRGRLDNNWKDPSLVTRRELFDAAKDLLQRRKISFAPTASMGCSIKWIK